MHGLQTQPKDRWIGPQVRERRHSHSDWPRALAVVLTVRGFAQLCLALYLALYLGAAEPLTQ